MTKPEVIDGQVTLTEQQYRLLVTAAAQLDFSDQECDGKCYEAAVNHARAALVAIGEMTAEQEAGQEGDE